MSELRSQLQQTDPLADAKAWLAHMQQTRVRLAGERALEKENDGLNAPLKQHDQKLEDSLRVAEHPVRRLPEAGFSCELADGDHARARL